MYVVLRYVVLRTSNFLPSGSRAYYRLPDSESLALGASNEGFVDELIGGTRRDEEAYHRLERLNV